MTVIVWKCKNCRKGGEKAVELTELEDLAEKIAAEHALQTNNCQTFEPEIIPASPLFL